MQITQNLCDSFSYAINVVSNLAFLRDSKYNSKYKSYIHAKEKFMLIPF